MKMCATADHVLSRLESIWQVPLRGEFFEYEAGVVPAEAERIGKHSPYFFGAAGSRYVVQITVRVRVLQINRWWQLATLNSES